MNTLHEGEREEEEGREVERQQKSISYERSLDG